MTDYFVSLHGAPGNSGLGSDASHATNRPKATVGSLLNTGSTLTAGDRIFVGPGGTLEGAAISPIAGVSGVEVIGDPMNEKGFRTAAGALLAPGRTWVSTRTTGDNDDQPAGVTNISLLTPAVACHDMIWRNLELATPPLSNQGIVRLDAAGNSGWVFEDDMFWGGSGAFEYGTGTPTAARALRVRRCGFMSEVMLIFSRNVAAASADADLDLLFEDFQSWCPFGISLAFAASGGNLAGGVRIRGADFICQGVGSIIDTVANRVSTVMPIRVERVKSIGRAFVVAGTAGQVMDDGACRNWMGTANTNFTPHASSRTGFKPDFVVPHLMKPIVGLEPPRNDWFNFRDSAHVDQKFNTAVAAQAGELDYSGTARPQGSGVTPGAHEVQEISQDTGSVITGGGANSLKLVGAGSYRFRVPVAPAATTFKITTKSTGYGGTNWPQMIVEKNPGIGVTEQIATATSAAEQELTVGPFTPTGYGDVWVEFKSRNNGLTGSTNFDKWIA